MIKEVLFDDMEEMVVMGPGCKDNTGQSTPSMDGWVKLGKGKLLRRAGITSSASPGCIVGRDKLCELQECSIKKVKVKSSKW